MPGTCARYQPAFSMCSLYGPLLMPPWLIAMTMSAPAFFNSGTYFFAASTTPITVTLPSRLRRSQSMIAGGVKPSTPMRMVASAPFAVLIVRVITRHGVNSGLPSFALNTFERTRG